MTIQIIEETADRLADYAAVPIRFHVTETFDAPAIEALRRGKLPAASPVAVPYWKDYDANPGAHPTGWPAQFEVARWLILAAFVDDRRVGGAVLILNDPRLHLLRGAGAIALLWDLRVAPDARRKGIGTALLHAAQVAALRGGARALRVETQQVNVPACRFYHRRGFSIEEIRHDAYPGLPGEILLLWRRQLTP